MTIDAEKIYDVKQIQKVYHQHHSYPGTVLYSTDKGVTWQTVGVDTGKWDINEWLFAFLEIKRQQPSIITFDQLPERIKNGTPRADFWNGYLKTTKIAILSDEDFNRIVDNNTKRSDGEDFNFISINNQEKDEFDVLCIRESAIN